MVMIKKPLTNAKATAIYVANDGAIDRTYVDRQRAVRPVISLKANTL